MEAVIYARYSSDSQREESIEDQVKSCKQYAKRNKLDIVKIYSDKALTGTSDKRPNFQQMIKDSSESTWERIICYKTDRFARSRADATKYKQILRKNGVKVVYAEMTIPIGPEGIILEGVMESIDEWYSANLSQNVKRGMMGNAEKCRTNGVTLFGYKKSKDDTYEIDEYNAVAVRKMFQMVLDNLTDREIVEWLNINGYKNTYGRPFDKNAVNRMTKNRKYIGEYKYGDIVVPHGMPAIIDDKTFERVQIVRESRISKRSRNRMCLLSGLLYCGECGESMNGTAGTSHTGKKYNYYTCNSVYKKSKCDFKRIPQEKLENFVIDLLHKYLFDENNLSYLIDAIIEYQNRNTDTSKLDQLKLDKKNIEAKISNLLNVLELGGFNETVYSRLSTLQQELKQIDERIAKENIISKPFDRDALEASIRTFASSKDASQEYKKRLIRTFVSAIYVYKSGRVVVVFNYKKNGTFASHEELNVLDSTFGVANEINQELYIDDNNIYIVKK